MAGHTLALVAAALGLTMAARAEVFDARDYGAVPDTPENMAPAIQAAIDAATAAGPGSHVVLEAGKYRVEGAEGTSAAIVVGGADEITIRGQGVETEIVVTNPRQGCFFFGGSKNCTVRDVSIDWDPLPFTQGIITAVDVEGGSFDLELEEGYPALDMPMFHDAPEPFGKWGMVFDSQERRLKTGAPDHTFIFEWEALGGRVWRMKPVEGNLANLTKMEPGDRFVHMARGGPGGAAFFMQSEACTVKDFTVYAAPGLVTGAVASSDIHFDGLQVRFKPGTTRLLTADADGIHYQQGVIGPTIEHCLFEGMADDSVNIYYPPNVVSEAASPTELVVIKGGHLEVGDEIQVFDSGAGRVKVQTTITKLVVEGAARRITLADPVEGVVGGEDDKTADTIYNLSRCGRGWTIRSNVFRDHRRHAIYAKAPDGIIEGNTLQRLAGLGIVVANCGDWPEGVVPTNVVIRNNTIEGVGYAQHYAEQPRNAAIQVNATARGYQLAEERLLQDIIIEGNTIIDPPAAAIYIGAANGVTVRDNRVVISDKARMGRETGAVIVENSEHVVIEGLRIESDRPETTSAVEIRNSVDAGDVGVTVRDLDVTLPEGATEIDDRR